MKPVNLATSDQPQVSILVLSQRNPAMLERCMASLARQVPSHVPFEVLLLCNGAQRDLVDYARTGLRGVRVYVSPVNLGYGGGNNRLAREARGELLVLLNDDTEVQPGWLEALLETADRFPRAAAVGSRVLFPDGTRQESGSVIFADGTTAPVGRGLPAGSSDLVFLRKVDYASACSLLVRKRAFEEVGGFDLRYFPAYYEDADLCLSLRSAGYDVLYDGRSSVLHHESQSTTTHFKHFLFRRNLARLRQKWSHLLPQQLPPPAASGAPSAEHLRTALEHARGPVWRVLLVDDMLPVPGFGAGFGSFHDMSVEVGLDEHALSVFPTKHPGADPLAVAGTGWEVLSGQLKDHLADPHRRYDLVILARPDNFRDHLGMVRKLQPQARVLYFAEALFYRRMEREAKLQTSATEAAKLRAQAGQSKHLELRTPLECDRVVCISEEEASVLRSVPGSCPVDVVVPLAAGITRTELRLGERHDLIYVASWMAGADSPNGDGLRWFVSEVLPHLVFRVPHARLRVTGGNAPRAMTRLAGPNVEFLGQVDDLRGLYAGAKVVVAPIRYGAGVKIKVVESLQYGVPVVTTTVGAEGIDTFGLRPMAVSDDPEQFAIMVANLLTCQQEWFERRSDIERWQDQSDRARVGHTWGQVLGSALERRSSGDVQVRA